MDHERTQKKQGRLETKNEVKVIGIPIDNVIRLRKRNKLDVKPEKSTKYAIDQLVIEDMENWVGECHNPDKRKDD